MQLNRDRATDLLVSLLGILAGFVVMAGMITANPLDGWTAFFPITMVATAAVLVV